MSEALDVLSGLVLEDGRLWADAAEPFQWEDARHVLGSPEPYHYLTRPRAGSKTTDLAGLCIAWLLTLPPRSPIDWLAADAEQGTLAVDAIAGFIARTPMLRGSLEVQARRVLCRQTGSSLVVQAADAPGAWGRTPRVLVVDELAQWAETASSRRLWEAASTSVMKRSDARMVILTTAGSPGHTAYRILEHAKLDGLWRVHETPGPVPWLAEDRIAEQRRRLPESSFRRLVLNEWAEGEDRLTIVEDLDAALTLDGPVGPVAGHRYVMGVDLGISHDRTAAAVCHRDGDEVVCDRLQVWSGTKRRPVDLSEVEAWIAEAVGEYNRASVFIDPFQAALMIERLRRRRVSIKPHQFTARSNAEIALCLHRLLRERRLVLPADDGLRDELANVRLLETSPGVYRLDHDEGRHDDRAVALGLAAFYLNKQRRERVPIGGAAANSLLYKPRMQWSHQ